MGQSWVIRQINLSLWIPHICFARLYVVEFQGMIPDIDEIAYGPAKIITWKWAKMQVMLCVTSEETQLWSFHNVTQFFPILKISDQRISWHFGPKISKMDHIRLYCPRMNRTRLFKMTITWKFTLQLRPSFLNAATIRFVISFNTD